MNYIVHALVRRLQHVGRGKSRYLDPGVVDIQMAINLYKEDPSQPPVGNEVLAGLGVRRNAMGLQSTGPETVEAPIGGPGFEWAGTRPQLSLPQAIIEELSDLSSDSEHEDTEQLEDGKTRDETTAKPAATPSTSTSATVLGEDSTRTATLEIGTTAVSAEGPTALLNSTPTTEARTLADLAASLGTGSSSGATTTPQTQPTRTRGEKRREKAYPSTLYNKLE
ncbi:hypothetical protein ASPVEDRAFT_881689 [Aspergillus versicolor CBS 583.65]|uniref:Uncharacterized protein n=1 Tax=Aspergillus versicolor CBS 583.65 TaxID=1036611 RepID=A0A1L9PAX5_ASPVE|nr:uncharacterized protein ASPVEDRAFT_881689 [Aspergillus versicolor CBS 583.65]OJI98679.1 hypothetical protein ASPVEDRAFT_881689 [Aspergillus versicolor CBS 583.65]